jgi:riboflavin kinase / FMN adenylyltransferase
MKRLFTVRGKVLIGQGRGKKMGFPTANIPAASALPKGTYISVTELHNKKYPSITFIGTVDTFDEKEFLCETYILDFDRDVYGETLQVHMLEKIRDNKKFESVDLLIKEIENDKKIAERYFKKLDVELL